MHFPLQPVYDENKGLCLVATRDIRPGETILKETPLTLALESQYLKDYCSTCAIKLDKEDKYDWKYHQLSVLCQSCAYNNYLLDEHNRFAQADIISSSDQDTGLYALLLRLFGKYAVGIYATMDDDVVCADFETSWLLASDDGPFNDELTNDVKQVAQYIRAQQSPVGKQLKQQEIEDLCRIVICNQHQVGDNIGRAFYPVAAMLNHSCEPNVKWSTVNSMMVCEALREIKQGEELVISYVPMEVLQEPFQVRRNLIQQLRQFECKCQKCQN